MDKGSFTERVLKAVVWITSLHSAAVGLGLILLPSVVMRFFGFW